MIFLNSYLTAYFLIYMIANENHYQMWRIRMKKITVKFSLFSLYFMSSSSRYRTYQQPRQVGISAQINY